MGARTVRLMVACPRCGSIDIAYSCDPACCFNHVCVACRASFLLGTRLVGEADTAFPCLAIEAVEPDLSLPTTACDRCGKLTVQSIALDTEPVLRLDGRARCSSCHALLELVLEAG